MFFGDLSHQFRLAPPSGLSRHGAELPPLTAVPNKLLRLSALVGCKVRPAFDKRSTVNTSANSVHNSREISTFNFSGLKTVKNQHIRKRGWGRVPKISSQFASRDYNRE